MRSKHHTCVHGCLALCLSVTLYFLHCLRAVLTLHPYYTLICSVSSACYKGRSFSNGQWSALHAGSTVVIFHGVLSALLRACMFVILAHFICQLFFHSLTVCQQFWTSTESLSVWLAPMFVRSHIVAQKALLKLRGFNELYVLIMNYSFSWW